MTKSIVFVDQAKSIMDFEYPLDRDLTAPEETVVEARNAALSVLVGARAKLHTEEESGPCFQYSSKKRFRIWYYVLKKEIRCFAILARDLGTGNSYSDPLKHLNAD